MGKSTILLLAAAAAVVFADAGRAQTAALPAKTGTRLITVGTAGGPVPRAARAQSANLLIVNGTPYLIDAGDGTTRRLAKMGFNFRTLGTVFVTHGHNDHTGGLGMGCRPPDGAAYRADRRPRPPIPRRQGGIAYYGLDADPTSDCSRTVPIEKVFSP